VHLHHHQAAAAHLARFTLLSDGAGFASPLERRCMRARALMLAAAQRRAEHVQRAAVAHARYGNQEQNQNIIRITEVRFLLVYLAISVFQMYSVSYASRF
jgi:hypothetical protein